MRRRKTIKARFGKTVPVRQCLTDVVAVDNGGVMVQAQRCAPDCPQGGGIHYGRHVEAQRPDSDYQTTSRRASAVSDSREVETAPLPPFGAALSRLDSHHHHYTRTRFVVYCL